MQIVFLLSLKKRFGGGDYSIFKFAEALAKQGHQIVVFYLGNSKLLSQNGNPTFRVFRKFNIELDFKGRGLINIVIDYIYDECFLHRFLKKNCNKIDFIVGYQREIALKADKLRAKYKIKTALFTFETPDWLMEKWPGWKSIYLNDKKLRKSWDLYKNALISADLIIANSNITCDETAKWIGRTSDLVLYPGISPRESSDKHIKKRKQIIYVGRLEENKNVNEIIEALALSKLDIKLVVCGRGSIEKELIELSKVKEVNVVFKGDVDEEEKWAEIEKSLFMVFPSSFEGFGMPPMEALSMGIPCICSNIPILKEVYDNYVEYFEEHDIVGLGEKMKMLLTNSDYIKERGELGTSFVQSKFSWEKSAKDLELKFSEYLNNNSTL
jgi:glycosyltransferase involved in cell wall biosynthesis